MLANIAWAWSPAAPRKVVWKVKARLLGIAGIGLGLLGALISSQARADWKGTVWGETRSEADRSFQIPHSPASPAEHADYWGEADFAFDYSTVGFQFHGVLIFHQDTGRLYQVFLKLQEPTRCPQLYDVLRAEYSVPSKEDKSKGFSADWLDTAHHNRVELWYNTYGGHAPPDCDLRYSEFTVPTPGGAL